MEGVRGKVRERNQRQVNKSDGRGQEMQKVIKTTNLR